MSEGELTIFIVDDDVSVRRGLERLLRAAGYRTETFTTAREFMQRGARNGRACLVLDVRLPGASGFDLQEALAKSGCTLPIVFITGHGDPEMAMRAMRAGAAAFLSKPFDAKDLFAAIDRAVAGWDQGPSPPRA